MKRVAAQSQGMNSNTINRLMGEAQRIAGAEAGALLLLVAAGRMAERLGIPLSEVEALLGSSYRASASREGDA